MKYLLLSLVILVFNSCNPKKDSSNLTQEYFFLDIRDGNNGSVFVNRNSVYLPDLTNYLSSRSLPSTTNARFIISNNTPISIINSVSKSYRSSFKEGTLKISVLDSISLSKLGLETFYLDIIDENYLLIDGYLTHVEDFDLALTSLRTKEIEKPKYIVSTNQEAPTFYVHNIYSLIQEFEGGY